MTAVQQQAPGRRISIVLVAAMSAAVAACDAAPEVLSEPLQVAARGATATAKLDPPETSDVVAEPLHVATGGAIAIANLDHLIAQHGDDPDVAELLLARARFLADHAALDRALAVAEASCAPGLCATVGDRVRRARARSAVHRFADALDDLAAAERAAGSGRPAGKSSDAIAALRASILVAVGRAGEVIPVLEAAARRGDPSVRNALAVAYAAVGRFSEADRLYAAALDQLDTTSPFPYAWIEFSRGVMWAEQAARPARGEALYRRALAYLPEFAAASIHLAELEAARGDLAAAVARIEPVAAASGDPEAIGLAGALHVCAGDTARGRDELARAGARFEALLVRHPLAFADHAAEFYLGAGANPERAWRLAEQNLAARPTDRAFALAIAAARATGREHQARALELRAGRPLPRLAGSPCAAAARDPRSVASRGVD